MTEAEWLAATNPEPMLKFLTCIRRRKLTLFACACCRRVWDRVQLDESREVIEITERQVEGCVEASQWGQSLTKYRSALASARLTHSLMRRMFAADDAAEVTSYLARRYDETAGSSPDGDERSAHHAHVAAFFTSRAAGEDTDATRIHAEKIAQCAILRDVVGNPFRSSVVATAWLAWQDGVVVKLARIAYDERHLPEGTLDPARLAPLGDALEDAGCTDAELLGHLRGPGPHVRGCWAVDLVLEKK
jgi:hypothetical protein